MTFQSRRVHSWGGALALLLLVGWILLACGCGGSSEEEITDITVATTTSAEDSGILDEFVKRFEKEYPYRVKAVAVGSGAALFMGRNGDADVLLTHEPKAEKEFMEAGYCESITKIMHNDFIIVGPKKDPARIRGLTDAVEAARRIVSSRSVFVSRGDASGTNAMELSIWEMAGVRPQGKNYVETGQGMGETIRIANEMDAYTLTDRATFIVLEKSLRLKIMVEGDKRLLNQYSLTIPNPKLHPKMNYKGAKAFLEFLTKPETKRFIENFGVDRYHKHLFYPD